MSHPNREAAWSLGDTIALTVVTGLAAAVRGARLTTPPFIYSDELFYAREACNYVYRSPATCGIPLDAVSNHPPLGKWLISVGVRALGWQPLAWRLPSLVAGTATVALLYLLARRLLGSTRAATFAAGLLAIDFLHVVQSRIAMLDVFLTLFVVASVLCVVLDRDWETRHAPNAEHERPPRLGRPWLLAAGVAAGAAIATKWVGVLALGGITLLWWIWRLPSVSRAARQGTLRSWLLRRSLMTATAFGLVPGAVYGASFVRRVDGPMLAKPWTRGSWARNVARLNRDMAQFHRESAEIRYLGTTNRFVSPAWSWPLIRRPMTYYHGTAPAERTVTIMAMGSPLVWWAGLAALAYLALRLIRRPTDGSIVAVLGFVVMYAPFLLVNGARAATFLYYMLPSVPFMCLALATVAGDLPRRGSRWGMLAFSAAALTLFAFFYPVLTGLPMTRAERDARLWFRDCRPGPEILAPSGWCWT